MHIGSDLILLLVVAGLVLAFPLWARLFGKKADQPPEQPRSREEPRNPSKPAPPETGAKGRS